jgi:hypothetical protein
LKFYFSERIYRALNWGSRYPFLNTKAYLWNDIFSLYLLEYLLRHGSRLELFFDPEEGGDMSSEASVEFKSTACPMSYF